MMWIQSVPKAFTSAAGIKPKNSWSRVQRLNHSATCSIHTNTLDIGLYTWRFRRRTTSKIHALFTLKFNTRKPCMPWSCLFILCKWYHKYDILHLRARTSLFGPWYSSSYVKYIASWETAITAWQCCWECRLHFPQSDFLLFKSERNCSLKPNCSF